MFAAIILAFVFQAVPDDADTAFFAGRREFVNGALERIENVTLAVFDNLKRLIVIVAAGVAGFHFHNTGNSIAFCRQEYSCLVTPCSFLFRAKKFYIFLASFSPFTVSIEMKEKKYEKR